MNHLILYCRGGFESECAAEIMERACAAGIHGFVKTKPGTGYVVFTSAIKAGAPPLPGKIVFSDLVFCRQMFAAYDELTGLPQEDRVGPCIEALRPRHLKVDEVVVETADNDEAKQILPFCRSFAHHFSKAVIKEGWLTSAKIAEKTGQRLHLFFLSSDRVYMGISRFDNSCPWYMGIPRLKFPSGAPSRSTLKLDEAFLYFIPQVMRESVLRPAMTAVDLGASPGGWSYQFVRRGILVIAVDNGPMDQALLHSGLLTHVRADGFSFVPERQADWMVCDIVEQPIRIAKLIGQWITEGWCRRSIFNLKLPMKKRYDEIKRCQGLIRNELDRAGIKYSLSIKQLYHDREEVTGFISREK
jgi:23S rRNA (cytidine2498-2'-O)-methyltransferase